jgi:hypothetical protein
MDGSIDLNERSGIPMSIVYSEIMWLGAVVLVLTGAALVGLWKRQNSNAPEPITPLLLSPAEREMLHQQKTPSPQKTVTAKKAARKAIKASRRDELRKGPTIDTTDQ